MTNRLLLRSTASWARVCLCNTAFVYIKGLGFLEMSGCVNPLRVNISTETLSLMRTPRVSWQVFRTSTTLNTEHDCDYHDDKLAGEGLWSGGEGEQAEE